MCTVSCRTGRTRGPRVANLRFLSRGGPGPCLRVRGGIWQRAAGWLHMSEDVGQGRSVLGRSRCAPNPQSRGSRVVGCVPACVRAPPGPRAELSSPLGLRSQVVTISRLGSADHRATEEMSCRYFLSTRTSRQARRQAKELLHAARAGDAAALERLAAVSAPLTLAGAQLALARELGQPSWAALVREIEARNASIPESVVRFLRSSVNLQIGVAARMLHENPALAESGFPAAVVLGDAARVEAELRRDPGAATRVDPGSGWTALHLACASRFHLDPARAPGLAEVARLLLDAGADASTARARGGGAGGRWSAPSRARTRAATTSRSSACCWIGARRCDPRRCSPRSTPPVARGASSC